MKGQPYYTFAYSLYFRGKKREKDMRLSFFSLSDKLCMCVCSGAWVFG